jgi:glycosyltransferase involved in cell wall biosynthesis
MRIGIGLNLLQPDNGGVTNYALTLMRHWPALAPDHPMVLFSFDHNEPLLAGLPAEARRHEIRLQTQEGMLDHLDKIDVYFCPFGSLWPRPVPVPTVLTFHDMQERFFPEFFTSAQHVERFFHYDWSLRMADAVIAVSDFTRQSCIDIVGIPGRKIVKVYHAPDELPEPVQPEGWPYAPDEPFLFYPANFWAHKNHAQLLEALARLRQEHGAAVRCVFTGSLLGQEERWCGLLERTGMTGRVLHLGLRPRGEVSWLFRHARGLIFPSLFEGFGIPVIEAMQCGCAVACAGTTALPEIAAGHALLFDPADPRSIAAATARLWGDGDLRTQLSANGRIHARQFSPARLVEGHLRAFALAIRRYHPWKHWCRRRFMEPRSRRPRTQLLPREQAAAARLLRTSARLA